MQSKFDIIIIGGGLSGLTMAIELLRSGQLENKTLAILEQRPEYKQDKSWCGWNVFQHGFEDCVTKKWKKWYVKYEKQMVIRASEKYQYQYIPSKNFYAYCLDIINQSNNIQLWLNCKVQGCQNKNIHTTIGGFSAETVYDARPATIDLRSLTFKDSFLLQCFYGWHIKTAHPVFNPEEMVLMSFPSDQSRGINFMYLLPFTENEALVEPTYFLHHTNIPDKEHFWQLAKNYLKINYSCENFTIIEQESGILPMMHMRTQENGIGTANGLLRPATGYAFYGIQRHTKNQLQRQLKRPYSKFILWMDKLFIEVCRKKPEDSAKLFFDLFYKGKMDSVIRFMHDEAKFIDYINVMRSMDKLKFIKIALKNSKFLWMAFRKNFSD